ncbi:MAG: lamin tail domain-containing protein [Chitinophagaceae bacterium]|nr:lamin tail domain-containing protein [Chitinophagaceae bacterium]
MKWLLTAFCSILCLIIHAQVANRYDVVIDEIMADPTPQVGLPNNEWVELHNISSVAYNLEGWRIGDAANESGPMPSFVLQPDSFVIVCTSSAVGAMSDYGRVISVTTFPSLDNDGDQIYLRSVQGTIVHSVSYTSEWYQNPVKGDGGWTLEMIDTRNPCLGMSNWKASVDPSGGTPGRKNSVDAVNNDKTPPALRNAYIADDTTIILNFDEPVDSSSGANTARYSINPSVQIILATTLAPAFTQVQLKLANALSTSTIYTITATGVTDCKGNQIGSRNSAKVGIPQNAVAGDVVINEILFNPRPNGYDYIELYNRSNKIINAGTLYIANRNSSGQISSLKKLSEAPFYIFPGDYVVITENLTSLQIQYLVKNPDAVLVLSSLPSFPDDEGTVILVNFQGDVVDEVKYSDDWHFGLIADAEGVSLERVDPDARSQDKNNWHSAASTAGYGTPGYQNSQFKQTQNITATVDVTPKVFSPVNDGHDDIATIQYQINDPGYVANITIFDAAGRMVRHLVKNATLAQTGSWNWDGLGEKGEKLSIGTYIIYTELFNLTGKKERFKNVIVLARKLH